MNELRNNRRGRAGVKGHLSVNFAKIPSGLLVQRATVHTCSPTQNSGRGGHKHKSPKQHCCMKVIGEGEGRKFVMHRYGGTCNSQACREGPTTTANLLFYCPLVVVDYTRVRTHNEGVGRGQMLTMV